MHPFFLQSSPEIMILSPSANDPRSEEKKEERKEETGVKIKEYVSICRTRSRYSRRSATSPTAEATSFSRDPGMSVDDKKNTRPSCSGRWEYFKIYGLLLLLARGSPSTGKSRGETTRLTDSLWARGVCFCMSMARGKFIWIKLWLCLELFKSFLCTMFLDSAGGIVLFGLEIVCLNKLQFFFYLRVLRPCR